MFDRGNDLTEKGGLVYFASGQQVALLNIGVVDDTEPEVDEMFTILLKGTSAVSVLIIIRGDRLLVAMVTERNKPICWAGDCFETGQ